MLQQGLREHFGWHGPGSDVMNKKPPRFHYATDFDIGWFQTEFDFILAQSIISHTGAAETELFFRNCSQAMVRRPPCCSPSSGVHRTAEPMVGSTPSA
jgi:hypothetical protein